VFIIALLISIQVIILEIQKYIGPKFILPKFLKKLPYNYYVDEKEEEDLNKSKLAVIEINLFKCLMIRFNLSTLFFIFFTIFIY